jgi:hypothetical protein
LEEGRRVAAMEVGEMGKKIGTGHDIPTNPPFILRSSHPVISRWRWPVHRSPGVSMV